MTNREASFLLGACRPNGADSSDPEFSEALAQAVRDPSLKGWLEDQQHFDSAVAARVQSLSIPSGLRSRILTGGRLSRPAPFFSARRLWAAAALLLLFAGLGAFYTMQARRESVAWENQALSTLSELVAGRATFDAKSPSVNELRQWLRANGSPIPVALPAGLQQMAGIGCKMAWWDGHPISILCFHCPAGDSVHLAIMDRSALRNPPPDGQPVYETRGDWNIASWSQGNMAMMLATQAPESQLRILLAMLLVL